MRQRLLDQRFALLTSGDISGRLNVLGLTQYFPVTALHKRSDVGGCVVLGASTLSAEAHLKQPKENILRSG